MAMQFRLLLVVFISESRSSHTSTPFGAFQLRLWTNLYRCTETIRIAHMTRKEDLVLFTSALLSQNRVSASVASDPMGKGT